ncbi:MAG: 1-acyl-sn-glycerol-3-phosphate acyltransferase, partial [Nocardioides sp.]
MRLRVRKLRQRRGWAFGIGAPILKPVLLLVADRTWLDGEKIPATGGCVLALNHISHLDPLAAAHLVYDHGRLPRML